MIEPPDAVMKRYLEAKEKGSPKATLDLYLKQYYHAIFANDPNELTKMVKRIKLEPFVHNSDAEVKELGVLEIDYYKKVYYDEWAKSVGDMTIVKEDFDKLDKMLTEYAQNKINEKTPQENEVSNNLNDE